MRKIGLPTLAFAGFCGGLAEVLWIASYAAVGELRGFDVARQVTVTVLPSLANSGFAVLIGLGIHFALSIVLGLGFGLLIWRPFARNLHRGAGALVAITVLAMIWAINFVVVLPALNPGFVALMPYPVTFLSKVLFGGAMVWTLQAISGPAERIAAGYAG